MILPAALCFAATVVVLRRWLDYSLPIAANLPYAAILIYGTRLMPRRSEASVERERSLRT